MADLLTVQYTDYGLVLLTFSPSASNEGMKYSQPGSSYMAEENLLRFSSHSIVGAFSGGGVEAGLGIVFP